jgi:hypothetical protein
MPPCVCPPLLLTPSRPSRFRAASTATPIENLFYGARKQVKAETPWVHVKNQTLPVN